MYKITEGDFKNQNFGQEDYLRNWPMLYILENGKQAYIGESNHVLMRMSQHKSIEEKMIFNKVHFIYANFFNQSVTFDYESKLIQYIAADEMYEITNKNAGLADKEYYEKKTYDEKFRMLWRRLQKEKLVRRSLEEIENSDLFKYSPFKELNDDQREAVESILGRLKKNLNQSIVINGMPGSGKTIVAIYLMKYLKDSEEFCNKKIGIVIPQTSLRLTIKKLFRSIYGLKASDVLSPSDVTKSRYDILLVDEAHRLHQYKNISYRGSFKKSCERLGMTTECDELDWILAQCECPIIFYDKMQVVGPSGIDEVRFNDKMLKDRRNRITEYFRLLTQMRVKGGNDYIGYIRSILYNTVSEKKLFDNYEFKMITNFSDFEKLMRQKDAEEGLSRMLAGYAWEWISKDDKSKKDIEIEGMQKMWNNRTEGWVHCDTAIDEVGCIHSIQGYDLNYAFVILGNDIYYDKSTEQVAINSKHYFDKNGKHTASYDDLLRYIKDIYYVLMTRGIKGTYLYVCNYDLKEYLEKFIEVI